MRNCIGNQYQNYILCIIKTQKIETHLIWFWPAISLKIYCVYCVNLTARQTDRQTGRHTDTQTDRKTERQTGRQTDRQIYRQTGRQADRQTGRQKCQNHFFNSWTYKTCISHKNLSITFFSIYKSKVKNNRFPYYPTSSFVKLEIRSLP